MHRTRHLRNAAGRARVPTHPEGRRCAGGRPSGSRRAAAADRRGTGSGCWCRRVRRARRAPSGPGPAAPASPCRRSPAGRRRRPRSGRSAGDGTATSRAATSAARPSGRTRRAAGGSPGRGTRPRSTGGAVGGGGRAERWPAVRRDRIVFRERCGLRGRVVRVRWVRRRVRCGGRRVRRRAGARVLLAAGTRQGVGDHVSEPRATARRDHIRMIDR